MNYWKFIPTPYESLKEQGLPHWYDFPRYPFSQSHQTPVLVSDSLSPWGAFGDLFAIQSPEA